VGGKDFVGCASLLCIEVLHVHACISHVAPYCCCCHITCPQLSGPDLARDNEMLKMPPGTSNCRNFGNPNFWFYHNRTFRARLLPLYRCMAPIC
jgi:hypothetical protein